MIIPSYSNIDIIQGAIGYGNVIEGITDWRIENISNGIFNILNSSSASSCISIIDNGNIGFGTTPLTSSSKLEINGDININSNYRKNNSDVINETSNYMLTTSNVLIQSIVSEIGNTSNYINRINSDFITKNNNLNNIIATRGNISGNNLWSNVSSGIYYAPTVIQNLPFIITSSPSATINGIIGTDRYISFTYTTDTIANSGQTQYTFTTTEVLSIDILIVGGGGSGGAFGGGGGGGGDVIYQQNISFPAGTYNINVGRGGASTTSGNRGNNGANSSISGTGITTIIAVGGGGGAEYNQSAIAVATIGTSSGGGGGGTGQSPYTAGATSQYSGAGGDGVSSFLTTSGGGGGSVGVGGIATIKSKAGNGGIGNDISIIGTSQQYGGGGGGGNWAGEFTYTSPNIGGGTGVYGGGNGAYSGSGTNFPATSGTANTGGGGGGGGGITTGAAGGSGIVIIRYRNIPTTNVGIGTTIPTSKLHLYDDITTDTKLSIENNYIDNVIISPATGYSVTETVESGKYYRTLRFAYNVSYPMLIANVASYPVLTSDERNLIAWYKLEGNLIDSSGVTGSLTGYNGGLLYTQDTSIFSNLPYAYYTNHNIAANTNWALTPVINRNVPLSFAFWFRQTSTSYSTIMGYGDKSVNGMGIQFDFYLTSGTSYQLTIYTALSNQWTIQPTATGLSLNTWYFCVYTLSSDNPVNTNLYVNGTWRASGTGTTGQTLLHSKTLTIGQSGDGAARGFGGNLADIRIYNKVLTQEEINTLYNINIPSSIEYSIKFNKSTTINVNNGAANTVQGIYNISLGPVNSSMIPAEGQSITPLTSTATTSVSIKYEYNIQEPYLPNLISVTGAITGSVTTSIIGTTERIMTLPYTSDSSGLLGQTQYNFTTTEPLNCDILLVGGGGGGGFSYVGGGGGGGGYIYLQKIYLPIGNYTVYVGNGGIAGISGSGWGKNGYDTSITGAINYIAIGGGGGAGGSFNATITGIGNNGGSGGGGSYKLVSQSAAAGGISTQVLTYGYGSGGNGNSYGSPWQYGGGGGGVGWEAASVAR
jgi:hypothetical protein